MCRQRSVVDQIGARIAIYTSVSRMFAFGGRADMVVPLQMSAYDPKRTSVRTSWSSATPIRTSRWLSLAMVKARDWDLLFLLIGVLLAI